MKFPYREFKNQMATYVDSDKVAHYEWPCLYLRCLELSTIQFVLFAVRFNAMNKYCTVDPRYLDFGYLE